MNRKEKVLCYACNDLIDVTREVDDYWESQEGTTCAVVDCPHCDKPNAITWESSVCFNAVEPDKEDLECYQE